MKLKLLLALIALLLFVPTVWSAEAVGVSGAGAYYNGGDWSLATFVGGDIPIFSQADSNGVIYQNFTRIQYFYVDSPDDIQGISAWSMHHKSLGLAKMYVAIGLGLNYQITDQEDIANAGMKTELGYKLPALVSIFIGFEQTPVKGKDLRMVYGGIDLNL